MGEMSREEMVEKIVELLNKMQTTRAIYEILALVRGYYNRGQ